VLERRGRVDQVLDHVAEHDRVPGSGGHVGREEVRLDDVEPELAARVAGGERARLDPERLPATRAGLGQEEPDPAAEVEQPAGAPGMALDALESESRRRPLPVLFVDVVG